MFFRRKTNKSGRCRCGSVRCVVRLPRPASEYAPRACDCEFCRTRGATYLSDPQGALSFHVREPEALRRVRQDGTNGLAEFLICAECDELMGAIYREKNEIWGAVNATVLEEKDFADPVAVSPRLLTDAEKISRWKQAWFPRVRVVAHVRIVTPL